jgi:hypothetical protein
MEESRAKRPDPTSPDADDADARGAHNGHGATPRDALLEGLARLQEIREYIAYFIEAKLDIIKATGRTLLLYFVAGVFGLVMGAALVATSAVLLLLGIAHGLGELFHHVWIGEVVVAVVVLGGVAGALMFGMMWLPRIMRKQLVSKYEARQRKQRTEFGRDVAQQARAGRGRTGHSN